MSPADVIIWSFAIGLASIAALGVLSVAALALNMFCGDDDDDD